MTPAEIRAALEAKGMTLPALSRLHGLRSNALSTSLTHKNRLPKHHALIAGFLGLPLHQVWPHLYRDGERLRLTHGYERRHGREVFERILRRLERGERLKQILAEPGMPSTPIIRVHLRDNPGFCARWRAAMRAMGGGKISPQDIERVRQRVASGENLLAVCREAGMPSKSAVQAWRSAHPHEEHRWVEALGPSKVALEKQPARQAEYLAAVERGTHWRSLGRMIDFHAIRRLRSIDTGFSAGLERARAAGRIVIARAASSRQLSASELLGVVEAAVRHIPTYARDDIRGDLAIALYEGRVSPEGAQAATRDLMTAWNRQFARRDISMDAEMGETGEGLTLSGIIADTRAGPDRKWMGNGS